MADKELVMELEEDISWLEQGCTTENEICEHIKQAIKTIIQHKEMENPWHTGTPTEEGWYLTKVKVCDCDGSYFFMYEAEEWVNRRHQQPVFAWQKIEED